MKGYLLLKRMVALAAVTSMIGMVLVVTLQVLARFALPSAPAWTEELSRVFFVYAVAFGIGVAVDRNELVRLSLLESYLSPAANKLLSGWIQVVIIVVSIAIAIYALPFVEIGHVELSPVLGIRMSWAFASSVVLMLVVAVFTLVGLIAERRKEGENP